MAGLLEYTKNGQVTEPPLYRFMRGNVQSFLNSIPDPSKMTPEQQLAMGLNANPIMGLLGMTAYHGSPYLFDKFDLSKAGSNSGQDYGYGLYFTSSPKVANAYTKPIGSQNVKDAGNVYKVDIPDEYIPKMINWSSYKQTPEVKEIFKKHGLSAEGSGEDLYFEAIKKAGSSDENKSGFQKAAEYLDSIGIKGVTYPNRGVGDMKDAQNYVLFNPSQIPILETTKGLLDK
jgi:hypothetical protein